MGGTPARATRRIELLRGACQRISPVYPDYAARAIRDGFSWSSSLADCAFDRLYLVVFRSVRRPSADLVLLREHDDRAYEEALESGGLFRYFKGEANERGECLSFCLWETREQAVAAVGAASHRSAAAVRPLVAPHFDEQPRNGYASSTVQSTKYPSAGFKIVVAENGTRQVDLTRA